MQAECHIKKHKNKNNGQQHNKQKTPYNMHNSTLHVRVNRKAQANT